MNQLISNQYDKTWGPFAAGALIAYVPWHYDRLRQTLPSIHDITTDPDNPPSFVAVVPLRQGEGINSVAYEGAKIAYCYAERSVICLSV